LNVPETIDDAIVWASVSVGGTHACGRSSDDLAYCWGSNLFGQLGKNSTGDALLPVAIDPVSE
jgi:alpha-tubulin suppressor-like RCC1 family protein